MGGTRLIRPALRVALAVVATCLVPACSSAGGEQAGAGAAVTATPTADAPAAPATTVAATTTSTTVVLPDDITSFKAARDYQTAPVPVAVRIPGIDVTSDLQPLRRNPDGSLEVPAWHHAGWWAEGPKPGLPGPAVIVGHVDTREGPDVFSRLTELGAGDEVFVTRADGSEVRFVVQRSERYPKDAFPTDAVFAPSLEAGLRLVTCGGTFDYSTGHYRDNVVVFAQLES